MSTRQKAIYNQKTNQLKNIEAQYANTVHNILINFNHQLRYKSFFSMECLEKTWC